MSTDKKYPAKIMLFGEYGVLYGGQGLAMPYAAYHAWWTAPGSQDADLLPSSVLSGLLEHCASLEALRAVLNMDAFTADLEAGWGMATNIPIGYGLGSSGSVVAAVFDRYHTNPIIDILHLKEVLGRMEDYFHQKSSGLDPLVCYLNKAVLTGPDGIEVVDETSTIQFELYDSEINRSTHHLVEIFRERMKDEDYARVVRDKYLPLNEQCIAAWQSGDRETLVKLLHRLSAFQLEYFNFAIPTHIRYDWALDLSHTTHVMKLCGAGGGGYMLRFALT
jgi:mevalonate kinase